MAEFVKHEPCPRCGSRDNLGKYSDGSGWCFGCHLFIPVSSSKALHTVPVKENTDVQLSDDLVSDFPEHVVSWLAKYDISVQEALKHGWKYSPKYDQLTFIFNDGEGGVACVQSRNFNPERAKKRKYYNSGSPKDVLPIFHASDARRRLVVVEDVVSAARIARQCDAMPLLGSYLPARKIMALKPFYEFLDVWLDSDKLKEAREIEMMAKWVGLSARTIYTELDPKEYSDREIHEYLRRT